MWNDSVSSVPAWRARTLSVVFLVSACGGDDDAPVCEVASQQRGAWDRGPEPPTRIPEGGGSSAWSGEELYVFGGNVAYAYDPADKSWRELAPPEPSDRSGGAMFWTGTHLAVFGSTGILPDTGRLGPFQNGLLYDPQSNTWEIFDDPGSPGARTGFMYVFEDGKLFLWGGRDAERQWVASGAVWDAAARTWTPLPTEGKPETAGAGAIAWSGKELLIWGGWTEEIEIVDTGAAYDPVLNRWRPLSMAGAPSRRETGGVWSGSELIIFGGIGPSPESHYFDDGAAYDPETDTWRPISGEGAPWSDNRGGFNIGWTGAELFAWSGAPECPFGGLYHPAGDKWTQITQENAPLRRWAGTFWMGEEVLMYGGTAGERFYYYDIVTFRPDD